MVSIEGIHRFVSVGDGADDQASPVVDEPMCGMPRTDAEIADSDPYGVKVLKQGTWVPPESEYAREWRVKGNPDAHDAPKASRHRTLDELVQLTEDLGLYNRDDKVSRFEFDLAETFTAAMELLLQRHRKYGGDGRNITNTPGGPLMGIAVRLTDKLSRLSAFVEGQHSDDFDDESVIDTLRDICCYAIIGVMVQQDTWPKA